MSIQNVQRFVERARQDTALRTRLEALRSQGSLEAIVALAAESGQRFSAADLEAECRRRADELTDAQLEAVAGGYLEQQSIFRQSGGGYTAPTPSQIIAILIG